MTLVIQCPKDGLDPGSATDGGLINLADQSTNGTDKLIGHATGRALPHPKSGNYGRRRPRLVCLSSESPKAGTGDQVLLEIVGVVDRGMGGEETLR